MKTSTTLRVDRTEQKIKEPWLNSNSTEIVSMKS